MTRLAVLGPGLLGGSLALAAQAGGKYEVAIWARRPEAVAELHSRGVTDRVSSDLRTVVADAELIVLCVPIGAMPALAEKVAGAMREEAIITDVGSVKAPVVTTLSAIFERRGRFVGSHPMAGSEQSGLAAARADLFQAATCIVTPEERSDRAAVEVVSALWRSVGGKVVELLPSEHDQLVACISHFPHLLAAALVQSVARSHPRAFELCGPGFRDVTRIASGPPEMWSEILRSNHEAVRKCAEAMIETLREIETLLDREPAMTDFLTQAKAQRDRLRLAT